jgi:hypothetical protein
MQAEDAAALERQVRREWGGERVYIACGNAEGKARVLGVALATGTSLMSAAEALGIPRRTAYRLAARAWVREW